MSAISPTGSPGRTSPSERRSSPALCSMAASLPALSRYRFSAGSPARKSGLPPGREKLVASPLCKALSNRSRKAASGGNVGLSVTARLAYRTGMRVATPVRLSKRYSGCIAGFHGQDVKWRSCQSPRPLAHFWRRPWGGIGKLEADQSNFSDQGQCRSAIFGANRFAVGVA